MTRKKSIGTAIIIMFGAVLLHWLLLFLGYAVMKSGVNAGEFSFFTDVYNRMKGSGDVQFYIDIAENWYHTTGDWNNSIVFYPLFPILMKCGWFIFHDYVISGIVISNIALAVANLFLYKLLKEEYQTEKAVTGLIFFNLFPVGFFLIDVYTESIFIMLSVLCLYFIRKKKLIGAGIVGMLAAFSRTQGVLLLVPAVYEGVLTVCEGFRSDKTGKGRIRLIVRQLPVLIIPLGTIAYFIINHVVYGQWNKFLEFQAAEPWYNSSHWITMNLMVHYNMAVGLPAMAIMIYWAQLFLFFATIGLLIYGFVKKNVRTSYLVYGAAYLFITYLHGWMISGPRYMMSCIPVYFILAASNNRVLKYMTLLAFGTLTVIFHLWFNQGQAVL